MLAAVRKLSRAFAGRSPGEIARLGVKTLAARARALSPAARRAARADRAFDTRWGTDTSAQMTMSALDFPLELRRQSHHYQASGPHLLDQAIAAAGIDPAGFTLIDYGCGKGRIVLLGAQKFAYAIGVEYSPILVAIAERNAATFMARGGAPRPPRFWQGNAADFEPPAGDLFCYLYNSFGEEILNDCLVRLEAAKAASPARRILLAYVDPRHRAVVRARGWRVIGETPALVVFDA
ncbi:MAG: hypothetical protein A4S12_09765 [Proteobacteria bacterium SG_bin5]|nr:hypothetical protein [Sphingomonas sp.]OQW40678.1 MAG: hypothetical protein A4S12_09765 [Proteobacteria bacterium SG_bin5]